MDLYTIQTELDKLAEALAKKGYKYGEAILSIRAARDVTEISKPLYIYLRFTPSSAAGGYNFARAYTFAEAVTLTYKFIEKLPDAKDNLAADAARAEYNIALAKLRELGIDP